MQTNIDDNDVDEAHVTEHGEEPDHDLLVELHLLQINPAILLATILIISLPQCNYVRVQAGDRRRADGLEEVVNAAHRRRAAQDDCAQDA